MSAGGSLRRGRANHTPIPNIPGGGPIFQGEDPDRNAAASQAGSAGTDQGNPRLEIRDNFQHQSWEEADLRAGIRAAGSVVGVFIVARKDERREGFVAYIQTGWARGFRPLRNRADRVFRSLAKLVRFIREEFRYAGEIVLYSAGDESLRRFRALLPSDQAPLEMETTTHEVADADIPQA